MTKFKIFASTFPSGLNPNTKPADEKANEWLEANPNVEVIDMKYQQSRCGDHSICIMYKEQTVEELKADLAKPKNYFNPPRISCCICYRSNLDHPNLRFGVAPYNGAKPGYICEDCYRKE